MTVFPTGSVCLSLPVFLGIFLMSLFSLRRAQKEVSVQQNLKPQSVSAMSGQTPPPGTGSGQAGGGGGAGRVALDERLPGSRPAL